MGLWKRGKQYWLDAVVHGHRYREPLGTTDWREAKRLERQRIEQLESKATVPTAKSLTYAGMDVSTAIKTYAEERRAQVSKRMAAYWLENLHPLEEFFKDSKLRQITPRRSLRTRTLAPMWVAHRRRSTARSRFCVRFSSERSCGTASPTSTRRSAIASLPSAAL